MIVKSQFDFECADEAGNHLQVTRTTFGLMISTAALRYSGTAVLMSWEDLKAFQRFIYDKVINDA